MTRSDATNVERKLRLMGVHSSYLSYSLRDFLHRSAVPFEWIELTTDEQARKLAGVENLQDSRLPVCAFPDGTRQYAPTIRQITEKLGWFQTSSRAEYDLAILGAGPAGLSAAVYGASEGLRTLLIERSAVGGQAGTSSRIENYLGFPEGISGADLAKRAREQASRFGAEILLLREGVRAELQPGKAVGYLADGTSFVMHSAICASGVEYRRLNLWNEERFRGAGVYYGAGTSEAELCTNKTVFVVGGGNSAGQAAMHFSRYAQKVCMIVRSSGLKETLSQYLIDRIMNSPRITVETRTEVTELHGTNHLEAITLTNNETGEQQTVETCWLFLCLGGKPNTEWAGDAGLVRDEQSYLVTGPDLRRHDSGAGWALDREPYYLETSFPGMFAAGDVRHGSVKRCASAVGEGAMAVTFAHRYLAGR